MLVDTNVLVDVLENDPDWADWSIAQLRAQAQIHRLVINPVIYAEISMAFDDPREIDDLVPATDFRRSPIPYAAAFLAAKAHQSYRRRGGTRSSTLPDFFIGAHALVEGLTLVTRDARRYRDAFPQVRVVAP